MADSNITKRAPASALKELMEELPFDKINVAHICERCDMNRKSFYYHFRDKYDLVNWIFDTEFLPLALRGSSRDDRENFIMSVCGYFYENRRFYRKALQIKGQDSFSDHFREFGRPLLRDRFVYLCGEDVDDDFILNFYTDDMICLSIRWDEVDRIREDEHHVDIHSGENVIRFEKDSFVEGAADECDLWLEEKLPNIAIERGMPLYLC